MKSHDLAILAHALGQLIAGPLSEASAVHVAAAGTAMPARAHGCHCHDTWEFFFPLRGDLQFATAVGPAFIIPRGHLLLVPPGLLHQAVNQLEQSPTLSQLVAILPGDENPYGAMRVGGAIGGFVTALTAAELAGWMALLGAAPAAVMDRVAAALAAGTWAREQAAGWLRVLFASYAAVVTDPQRARPTLEARRIAEAQLYLQAHYYEAELSVARVARVVGLSASHLGQLFRASTGGTIHQALVDIRLRRATNLLIHSHFPIKEIAALTGWSNQLYFSAAYRRRYGQPPSAVRRQAGPGGVAAARKK